ncbi:HU family DNA-binding protein [Aliifodinibius sp. S!AR15-10]|uniref:HU family DNA-binding protein n=1 Tax=Aliifodinibius sp. S!AR15-10 TaxID=2950437 RepID=UPI002864E68B|nr:HU family DNA-binding protein [Aliifodinibius sp. S!AR15-10]MDR8394218.1 HU family DNA-binding protein [Aliifodinibius sp. S!AR15-10]
MEKEFLAAFADIIRNQLVRKNDITIQGLGTFKQEHIKQFQQQHKNGQVVMMPPKDIITFIPDKEEVGV